VWHGDTFEAIRLDPKQTPPLDMFYL